MKYEIVGSSMQFVRIMLDEGEKIYSDSGKLINKTSNIVMTPRMAGGIIKMLERKATGATGLLTEFESKDGTGAVSVAGAWPGKVKAIPLAKGQGFVADRYSFIAAEESVSFTIQTIGLQAGLFGGEGFILQKFVGPGTVFIHVIGDIIEHQLDGTTQLEIEPSHLAGFDATLQYKIRFVDNIRTMMFGGVGLFLADFVGKGNVIMHSVSRYKLAAEIYQMGLQANKKK